MTELSDIPEGYKTTELGVLPEEWNIGKLDHIGILIRGVSYKDPDLSEKKQSGFLPVLRAMNIRTGSLDLKTDLVFVKQEKISEKQILKIGDIVIAMSSGSKSVVGKAAQLNEDWNGSFGAFCAGFRPQSNAIDKEFIGFLFQTTVYREYIEKSACGTNIKNLTIPHILNYPIPLPPLSEQHAIATTLRTVQEAKEKADAVIAATKALKAAMMKHLFTYGPVPPEEAEKVVLKETEIGQVPEVWDVEKFSEVVDIAKGQIDPTKEPYHKLLHIGPENIVSGTGQVIRMRTAEEINLISGQFYFTSEHIIYSKIRPYLKKVAFPKIEGTCSADMYPLKPKDARLFSEFLFQYLLSDRFSDDAISFQDRTGIPKINRQQIGMIHLPIPPFTIQKQIAAILTAIDKKLAAEQSRKEALDTLFTTLLHDLMTAKIRINPEKLAV